MKKIIQLSTLVLFALTFSFCARGSTPSSNTVDLGDGNSVSGDSDLGQYIQGRDEGVISPDANIRVTVQVDGNPITSKGGVLLDGTTKLEFKDTAAWKKGYTLSIPSDKSRVDTFVHAYSVDFQSNGGFESFKITRAYFDQDGVMVVESLTNPDANRITDLLGNLTGDLNKINKMFEIIRWDDTNTGEKLYVVMPTLYIQHNMP